MQQQNKFMKEETMQPQFVTKPAFTVVGLLLHTTAMAPEIPQLWDRLVPRMGEIQYGIEPMVSYGMMDHFNPETVSLDYLAGNPVSQVVDLPAGMTRWDIPANTYAVFETTIPTIGETFNYIYNTWLHTSGYKQAAAPYFERYGEDFSPEHPTLSIYIPVEQKA
jgi:AraC family transcriptional regulator